MAQATALVLDARRDGNTVHFLMDSFDGLEPFLGTLVLQDASQAQQVAAAFKSGLFNHFEGIREPSGKLRTLNIVLAVTVTQVYRFFLIRGEPDSTSVLSRDKHS